MRVQIVTFSQDFCHHGDTICHPKSSYVTTKLNGMSTCGCNNNSICSDKAIFTFPTIDVSATLNAPQQSTGGACQSSEMAAVLNSLYFVFNNFFLSKSVGVFLCSRVNDTMFKCLEPASVKRLVIILFFRFYDSNMIFIVSLLRRNNTNTGVLLILIAAVRPATHAYLYNICRPYHINSQQH